MVARTLTCGNGAGTVRAVGESRGRSEAAKGALSGEWKGAKRTRARGCAHTSDARNTLMYVWHVHSSYSRRPSGSVVV